MLYGSRPLKDCEGRHGGTGFCQREPNETFKTCFDLEWAEFTSDVVGTIFAAANGWAVTLLLSAACGCSASQCGS